MVASRDVIVAIVLYAFLSVLWIKFEFFQQSVVELRLNRHLFFAWEQTHVPVSVLDLK